MGKTLKDKINEGRQYRNLTLQVRAVDQNQEDEYIIEGYATTFDEPYELYHYHDDWSNKDVIFTEVVRANAFDETDMSDTILQYDHCGKVYARVSNDTLKLSIDNHGLKVEAKLGGTTIGRQLYEEIKGGYINKMSFGFTIDEEERTTNESDSQINILRTILKVGKLYDVSVVSIPANDSTEVSTRSYCDGVIAELQKEFLEKREIDMLKLKISMKGNL